MKDDTLRSHAADRLDGLFRQRGGWVDAAYIAAVSDPAYERAFARILADPMHGHLRMTPEETAALQEVIRVESLRALNVGTGSARAFAVPLAPDPTVLLSSDGQRNPIRQLATVSTITATKWQGVTSEGIVATYAAEATEVGDGSPVLVQPEIETEKAQAFVPFTFEVGADRANVSGERAMLFSDPKDTLEATKFSVGAGAASNEPEGIITGAGSTVTTAGSAVYAVGDAYLTQEALPPRYQANAVWLANNKVINESYRFVRTGDADEPPLVNADRTSMLGKPLHEVSDMSSLTTTSGEEILLYGDVAPGTGLSIGSG